MPARRRTGWGPRLLAGETGHVTCDGLADAHAFGVARGFLFNGAISTYEKIGFVRNRKIGKRRWVVTRVVEPPS